jgi:formate-dependent phosphoribosylglycinamide formyltransferase (GAR transformylase)
MSENALKAAQDIASKVVNALGGKGLFGVEYLNKLKSSQNSTLIDENIREIN